jgi:predicted lipoprotein with Yx(FWY)xxD motif
MIRSLALSKARNRRLRMLLVLPAAAAAAAVVAGCSSSGTPSGTPSSSSGGGSSAHAVAAAGSLNTAKIGGATVLANAKGFTLYSFAPDTSTMSKCNGACATAWPPVKGPATARVTGKLGTIKRSDGSAQATFDGHPLYTFVMDTGPGTDKGNGVNAFGGLWHALTASGSAAPASTPSGSSSQHHSAPPSHAAVTTPAAPPATAPAQTANPIPQGNGGDHDADNNGGPSDGDGNI